MRSRNVDGTMSNYFGDSRDYYFSSLKRNSLVDITQHYKSVSYLRKFFESDFMDFWNEYHKKKNKKTKNLPSGILCRGKSDEGGIESFEK